MDNIEIKDIIYSFLNDYCNKNSMPLIQVNVCITDDMFKTRLEMTNNIREKIEVRNSKSIIENFNGTISFSEEKPTIILNKKLFLEENNLQFIQTLIHEYVHIIDHIDFCNYFDVDISQVDTINDYKYFYYWSEFHAHTESYRYYKLLFTSHLEYDEQVTHILETEKPIQDGNVDFLDCFDRIYRSIEFLKRYIVWEEIIKEKLEVEQKLYPFLDFMEIYKKNQTFKDYIKNKNIFYDEINRLRQGE